MVIAWNSFLSIDLIETAPSGNILVNKSKGGIKVSPMNRHKWGENGLKLLDIPFFAIFGNFSPLSHALMGPLNFQQSEYKAQKHCLGSH